MNSFIINTSDKTNKKTLRLKKKIQKGISREFTMKEMQPINKYIEKNSTSKKCKLQEIPLLDY